MSDGGDDVVLAMAIGGRTLRRDDFLTWALRRGAHEAVWIDPALAWGERYRRPVTPATRPEGPRFRRRELLWPGEVLVWHGGDDG